MSKGGAEAVEFGVVSDAAGPAGMSCQGEAGRTVCNLDAARIRLYVGSQIGTLH